jgi:hypothetical protein
MALVYITQSNAARILRKFEFDLDVPLSCKIYEISIYMFNKYEQQYLLKYQVLMQHPELFVNGRYQKIQREDSYRYIYENYVPAYHYSIKCERLHSDYQNFWIPDEIKEQGKEKIEEFRSWFQKNSYLRATEKSDVFNMRMFHAFKIKEVHSVSHKNSGIAEIENLNLAELKEKLDSLIKEAGRFYYQSAKNKLILKKYQKRTYLLKKEAEPLEDNDTEFSDEDIKAFLESYNDKFKKPIIHYLQEYYRIKYNPDLAMESSLLDALGFQPCNVCRTVSV